MKLLLDTQAFLWFVADDPRLSAVARNAIEDDANERAVSTASVWEMAIKHSIGKLAFHEPFEQFLHREIADNMIGLLAIEIGHVMAVALLPMHHRDPFDRLLVAQAKAENMEIVSIDAALDSYGIRRIW